MATKDKLSLVQKMPEVDEGKSMLLAITLAALPVAILLCILPPRHYDV